MQLTKQVSSHQFKQWLTSLVTLFFVTPVFGSWDEDFQLLKDRPRSYEVAGAICEELARIKFEKQYNNSNYEIEVGIAYGDRQRTIGELDIIVFSRETQSVIHIAEVKCWKDMSAGLEKARDQRLRFLNNVKSTQKQISFQSTSRDQTFAVDQFRNVTSFSTIGQKGSVEAGYDAELDYDLRELHHLSMDMIRCQDRSECAKPAKSEK